MNYEGIDRVAQLVRDALSLPKTTTRIVVNATYEGVMKVTVYDLYSPPCGHPIGAFSSSAVTTIKTALFGNRRGIEAIELDLTANRPPRVTVVFAEEDFDITAPELFKNP